MMVSFTDHYNAVSITDSPQKQKLEKVHGTWIILFYVRPSSSQLQSCFKENSKILSKNFTTQIKYYNFKEFAFLLSYWWENTKSSFKENARTFSKNSTTQENIRISILKEACKTYVKKKTSNQNSLWDRGKISIKLRIKHVI